MRRCRRVPRLTAGSVAGFSFTSWSNGDFNPANDPSSANPVCLVGNNNTQNISLTYTAAVTDTTPPVITPIVTPASRNGSNGWYKTGNITVSFTVTDAQSAITSRSAPCAADATTTTVNADGTTTVSCTATSSGGTATQSVTIKRDTTVPTITFQNRTAPNANGWNSGNVTVNWSCTDTISGPVSSSISQTVTTEGSSQSSTGTCTDNAGNTSSNTQTGINIDKTNPTIVASATVTGGGSYTSGDWTKQTVTVHFTCSDALSGIASGDCPADVVVSADTLAAGQNVSGNVSDRAGNSASSNTINVKVDKTDPSITFVSQTPAANANGWNNSDVTVKWSCADALSGPVSGFVTDVRTAEGTADASGTCTDNAGNSASATREVKIDKTNPTITFNSQTPAANGNGWNNSDVTVKWDCADTLSGLPTPSSLMSARLKGLRTRAVLARTRLATLRARPVR